jgi:cyclic pyranopterin phosphate synthase
MLVDTHARRFTYLRLSLTEACNFRCSYCLPEGTDCSAQSRTRELQPSEIQRLVSAFARLGTRKIRLTGGEPSLRRDLPDIIHRCKTTAGIDTVALTTNGYRLLEDVANWRAAGLDCLNLSIDSLDPARFALITGHDKLRRILAGLDKAVGLGFRQIKLNTVLMRDCNDQDLGDFLQLVRDRPLTLRFIELMRTGDNKDFFARHHLSGEALLQQLQRQGWTEKVREAHAGPARELVHPDYRGSLGFILPYSRDFCASCNRLRVSAEGKLFLCLFADQHQDLRPLLQSDDLQPLMTHITNLISGKSQGHQLGLGYTGATRQLAMIGG